MSTEKNKAALLRWLDAYNKKDLNVLDKVADEVFAADYILHGPGFPEEVLGSEGVKKFVHQYLQDNSDFHITLEDMIADGDKVAGRLTMKSTNAATGKSADDLVIFIDRFVEGKIAEEWQLSAPGQW